MQSASSGHSPIHRKTDSPRGPTATAGAAVGKTAPLLTANGGPAGAGWAEIEPQEARREPRAQAQKKVCRTAAE